MSKSIYGKDTYNPGLWQKFKDWIKCKLGKHNLPLYISTGVYECSRCDYRKIESERSNLPPELINELVEKTKPYWDPDLAKTSAIGLTKVLKDKSDDLEEVSI